jgi:LacI family repressor for deo operon, udp, cdd, tsx, nupC, and nupG
VFAYSDEMAFGVLHALRRHGVDVPAQMSVIGVDDHPMADLHELTTVGQDVQAQGAAAARITLDLLRGRPSHTAAEHPTRLVLRGTTGPAPG